jgi:cysteine desulfuration protein SufE
MTAETNTTSIKAAVSAEAAQQEIVDEFSFFDDWTDRYRYIIDLGRDLQQLPEAERSNDKLLRGCQSRVWLAPVVSANSLSFRAATDAAIVAGLISLVLRVYNGRSAAEIRSIEPWFVGKIGLQDHLSPTRSNGLHAMLTKIKDIARQAA